MAGFEVSFQVLLQLRQQRAAIDAQEKTVAAVLSKAIQTSAANEESALLARVLRLVFNDTGDELMTKLAPGAAQDRLHAEVEAVRTQTDVTIEHFVTALRRLQFSLPAFAADGSEAGVTRTVSITAPPKAAVFPAKKFTLAWRDNMEAILDIFTIFKETKIVALLNDSNARPFRFASNGRPTSLKSPSGLSRA